MALLMVWLGSMHIRSFPFGFSFSKMFESQSVGCVTGLMMSSLQSLSDSSFILPSFDTGTRCTVPRGFPRPGLNTSE